MPLLQGHMISYSVSDEGEVHYVDAHLDISGKSRVFEDFQDYMSNAPFQEKVFYKKMNQSASVAI